MRLWNEILTQENYIIINLPHETVERLMSPKVAYTVREWMQMSFILFIRPGLEHVQSFLNKQNSKICNLTTFMTQLKGLIWFVIG